MGYTEAEFIVLGISLLVILAISFVLRLVLKNKSNMAKQAPFFVITVILLVLEIIKQVLAMQGGYSIGALPMHFCSTYFVWFSLANFTKGKFRAAMKTVAFVSTIYLVALFYFAPVIVIGDACKNIFATFGSFHTFVFHHLVILYFFLCLFLKNYHFEKRHLLHWVVSISAYYLLAVFVANKTGVNFMSILYCEIQYIDNIRLTVGQLAYNIGLGIVTVGIGACIIALASHYTQKKEKKYNH